MLLPSWNIQIFFFTIISLENLSNYYFIILEYLFLTRINLMSSGVGTSGRNVNVKSAFITLGSNLVTKPAISNNKIFMG